MKTKITVTILALTTVCGCCADIEKRTNVLFITNTSTNIFASTSVQVDYVLSTNWLFMTLQSPIGDGTVRNLSKEVGIVISNRYATVVADNSTNKILLSSTPIQSKELLIRDAPAPLFYTNMFPMFPRGWTFTNYTTWP